MTEAKMIKQEIKDIKEDNSIDINEQNIAEIINLKEFSKPMTEPPSLEKDSLNNDSNRQNTLSLTNKVILQKRNTKIINKEFLTEVVLTKLETDNMNERLIPFKNETEFEELTWANKEKLINDHICNERVKSYDLRIDILLKFILNLIKKEISYLNKVTILKDVNKERICRRHLTENSLDEHLTDDDKKKETKICSYSLEICSFLHKYQYKVQSPCAEELSRKGIKDGNKDAIFCSQYAWTNSMIEVPNKIIVNTLFIVSLNSGPLADFPINKRLYEKTLFHIPSQNEIYSNIYMDRIILDFKTPLTLIDFIMTALIL